MYLLAQDPYFGQLGQEYLYYNPANASFTLDHENKGRAAVKYRDQWNSISSPTYRTALLEGEYKLYQSTLDSWHLGGYILSDRSNGGLLSQNGGALSTAYSRRFGSYRTGTHEWTVGASYGFIRTNANTQELWFSRQYDNTNFVIDPNISNGETMLIDNNTHTSLALGARWIYRSNRNNALNIGFAMHHINQQATGLITSSILTSKKFISLAYSYKANSKLQHKALLNILSQAPAVQLIPGYELSIAFEDSDDIAMTFGIASRLAKSVNGYYNDAILTSLGLNATSWMAQLSYEANTSGIGAQTQSTGSIELTLEYYLRSE